MKIKKRFVPQSLKVYTFAFFTDVTASVWEPGSSTTGSTNILGLVVFSVLMGVILSRMKAKGKPLVDFCNCLADATMNIFVIFIW